jgi:hypothetical protein
MHRRGQPIQHEICGEARVGRGQLRHHRALLVDGSGDVVHLLLGSAGPADQNRGHGDGDGIGLQPFGESGTRDRPATVSGIARKHCVDRRGIECNEAR